MEPMVVMSYGRNHTPILNKKNNFFCFLCHSYSLPLRVSQEVPSPERLCPCLP